MKWTFPSDNLCAGVEQVVKWNYFLVVAGRMQQVGGLHNLNCTDKEWYWLRKRFGLALSHLFAVFLLPFLIYSHDEKEKKKKKKKRVILIEQAEI